VLILNLKDAKAGFSGLIDKALKGEFVTITRHGKPVAALASVEAAELALKAMDETRAGLLAICGLSPAVNSSATGRPREMLSFERLPARHQCRFDARALANGRSGALSRMA